MARPRLAGSAALLATLALSTAVGGPANAANRGVVLGNHVAIFEVAIDDVTDVIDITGQDFDFGPGPLLVMLGDLYPGDITGNCAMMSANLIICDLFTDGLPPAGDYLLRVSNGDGESQARATSTP